MLLPLAELNIHQVPLGTQIRKDRGITVNTLVCSRHPFLFRLGIVERADVDIHCRQLALAGGHRSNTGRRLTDQSRRFFLDDPIKCPVHHIQPLPEGRTGRTLLNPQTVTEKGNVPKRLNRLVVRLSHAQQSDHRFHNIAMGDLGLPASGQRHGVDTRPQVHTFHQGADQGQSRMAGQMFVALFDDKFYRSHLHLPGVISGTGEYHNCSLLSSIYIN